MGRARDSTMNTYIDTGVGAYIRTPCTHAPATVVHENTYTHTHTHTHTRTQAHAHTNTRAHPHIYSLSKMSCNTGWIENNLLMGFYTFESRSGA